MNGRKWNQTAMFQIIGETESFYVLLETWRELMVISPEAITSKFGSETSIDVLDLTQLGISTLCCTDV